MKGSFETEEKCISELRNENFIFYTIKDGLKIFINKAKQELAEVNVYSDNSASALIGKYKTFE